MNETAHTPLPWAVNEDRWMVESKIEHGWVNDGWVICKPDGPDAKANAAFIVTACNSYYDNQATIASQAAEIARLREALEEIRDQELNHGADARCRCTDADKLAEARSIARAALEPPLMTKIFSDVKSDVIEPRKNNYWGGYGDGVRDGYSDGYKEGLAAKRPSLFSKIVSRIRANLAAEARS